MKSGYNNQLNFGIEIHIKYSVLKGKIIHLVLQNHIFPEQNSPSLVEYEVLSHPVTGDIVAGYGEYGLREKRIPEGKAVDPEKTIPNLVGMILNQEIHGADLFNMFTLSYEVLKTVS